MSDPIGAAIEAAVQRALDARLPTIINALRSVTAPEPEDRFIPIREAAKMIGTTPTNAWRLERLGRLPPREKIAGRLGYRLSTIKAILAGVGTGPMTAPASAIKSGERRGGRQAKGGAA